MLKQTTLLLATGVVLGTPASAQYDSTSAQHVRIALTSYRITPATINMERGHTYILDLENASGSSHDFTARDFFASAQLSAQEREIVEHGEIELKAHQSATIAVTPTRAGNFEFHCGHPFHQMLGMRGVLHVN